MAHIFYVLMQKRGDGKVYADLHKSLPTIFLTDTDAQRSVCIDGALAHHRDVVELVAMTKPEYDEHTEAIDLCTKRMTELVASLEVMCRLTLLNPYAEPGDRPLLEYDTWGMTVTTPQRDALKQALILVAKYRGKSTFGNDWQDALQ